MWSHFDFAIVFAGLGYVGLWAFAAADVARKLSPGLQIVGLAAAVLAALRVVMLMRARRTQRAQPEAGVSHKAAALVQKIRRNVVIRHAPKRRPPVAPRSEFGLRKPGSHTRR